MPLSSAIFKSEHRNPVPQCPPRLDVQTIVAVMWSRMPNTFLNVETARVSERHGWVVQCLEPLQMMAVHIPEENRCAVGFEFIIYKHKPVVNDICLVLPYTVRLSSHCLEKSHRQHNGIHECCLAAFIIMMNQWFGHPMHIIKWKAIH